MEMADNELLKQIIQNTDSGILLFFVIVAVVLVPLGVLLMKHNRHRHEAEDKRRQKDTERELNIIQVVTSNTEVMTGLKTTLETNNTALNATITRIHDRIDGQCQTLQAISSNIALIKDRSRGGMEPV